MSGMMILFCFHLLGILFIRLVRVESSPRRKPRRECTFSVLIAARKEERNLKGVLEDVLPQGFDEVLVVDDHSDDKTREIAMEAGARVISLDKSFGKKAAIEAGVDAINSDYVLQLDADVRIGKNFLHVLKLHVRDDPDMLVLPIRLPEKQGLLHEIQRHEQAALLAISSSLPKPILANGANMLYKAKSFRELNGFEGNRSWSSGDDHFLLGKMIAAGKDVHTVLDEDLIADTKGSDTLQAFFDQRIRWAGKLRANWSWKQVLLGSLTFALLLLPSIYLFLNCSSGISSTDGVPMLGLSLLWYTVQVVMLYRMNAFLGRSTPLFSCLLASILFPFYSILVFCVSIFVKPIWKGREI